MLGGFGTSSTHNTEYSRGLPAHPSSWCGFYKPAGAQEGLLVLDVPKPQVSAAGAGEGDADALALQPKGKPRGISCHPLALCPSPNTKIFVSKVGIKM